MQAQEKFDELHRRNERLKKLITLHEATIKAIQESCAKSSKASEETNKILNQVFEEQYHCKRDRDFLDQDINRFFNIFQKMKPKPQGHALDNSYQEDIKPDVLLDNMPTYSSHYQDGYNMTYSEEKGLKRLPEASSLSKFSGVGQYNHMELIDYIDVPSIPDYWITSGLGTAFKVNASIWYAKIKEIHGGRVK
ncbi:hypothetical protein O181_120509 [Austropuccinia psidii MF-1]|uniref:Uncharacterized protein n=1 Tax=Austropuccinia psidii MF-1 TaxID=1389203 RepID=A0A9Q3KJ94_9BASI|nr:hypothetical protein [Austropuccinia psidii MF-1]